MKSKKEPRVTELIPQKTNLVDKTPIVKESCLNALPETDLPSDADRVGNLTQKERAAYKVGVTREKLLMSIRDGLVATKMEVVEDSDGRQHVRTIPDLDKRLKATEMGLKFFGDMKEVVGPVTNNIKKVVYVWRKTEKVTVNGVGDG